MNLMRGDCLERMKEIPDGSVDMILCDLPYGTTACKWDTVIPFEPLWEQYKRVIKKNGAIVLFGSQPFTSALVMSNIEMFRYQWVWQKNRASNQMMAKAQPLRVHEDVLVFSLASANNRANDPMRYFPQDLVYLGKETKQGSRITDNLGAGRTRATSYFQEFTNYPKSVLSFGNEGSTVHPTQKPVTLCEYLIRTYTNENETVMDNAMGSGTTGVACVNTNRHFIGIEMDDNYFDIAQMRIAQAMAGMA